MGLPVFATPISLKGGLTVTLAWAVAELSRGSPLRIRVWGSRFWG